MVDLDSWAGGYRLLGAVIGSVFRMLGGMRGLSGTDVLWRYACFNTDTVSYQYGYFFYIMIHSNTGILPFP